MERSQALPELLAPAGNFDCLVAAIAGGADAVYIGGERFGARAYAENFDTGSIKRAVTLCKLCGVKLYVTVNTLITDREMEDAIGYAALLYRLGVDALIVADVGLIRELRRAVPDMELHASTQLSVHNTPGADEAYGLGCERVVVARELSLENIRSVTSKCKPEIEVFLHGALCVSHSGQCLFSSLVGGRSGNRGECAQPCRLPYGTAGGKGYPLSLKDLSLASFIPELIESGVASLKIEGRMKSPHYVYTVTSIYRRLLDEGRAANPDELSSLRRAFSRDGFTEGYFTGKLDTGMTGVRSEQDKQDSRELEIESISLPRHRVWATVKIASGVPSSMTLRDGSRTVSVTGDVPENAENHPLTEADVTQRLCKMGNTFLSLSPSDVELELEDGLNLSPAKLNALRRAAADAFEDFGREYGADHNYREQTRFGGFSDEAVAGVGEKMTRRLEREKTVTAQFFSERAYMDADIEYLGDISMSFVPLFSSEEAIRRAGAVFLPPVVTDMELSEVRDGLSRAVLLGVKVALADNIGHFPLIREAGLDIYGGFRLNIYNMAASEEYKRLGAIRSVLSPELTLPQARDISDGVITYGRIPLMLTERCFIKDGFGCGSCGSTALTDRVGERFPMLREWGHRNLILNSGITYMGDRPDELRKYGIAHEHYLFTIENGEEIGRVLQSVRDGRSIGLTPRRVGRREATKPADKREFGKAAAKSADKREVGKTATAKLADKREFGKAAAKSADKRRTAGSGVDSVKKTDAMDFRSEKNGRTKENGSVRNGVRRMKKGR